jgi:thiol:disulfide interchange protein
MRRPAQFVPVLIAFLVAVFVVSQSSNLFAFQDEEVEVIDTLFSFDDVVFDDATDTSGEAIESDVNASITEATSENSSNKDMNNSPRSLWGIFIAGLIGGFAAFLMPCIYPMVPLTVSFFTKQSGSRTKGVLNSLLYGLFIIVIYVALGMIVTLLFGASALNEAASSAWFNLLFFLIILVFAVSFLGAFEITLPSRFVNKMDEKSNKGGLVGLFFMAFTLALVSFSCTGPIIGYLLVEAVAEGALLGPAVGMLGFSVALAIPFMIFAFFPFLLKEMPKSGGWLNSVKVSLGFLELALALKFLSNVDLAYHWGILDREIFLALWIVIFGLFGLYLLGKLRFSHDSEVKFISIPRLFFAIVVLSFTVYMVPGLWGAPLKGLSAWLPPSTTQDFNLHQHQIGPAQGTNFSALSSDDSRSVKKKYKSDRHQAPHGLDAFYDYEQALEFAKQVNKPVLIDFTGWTCVNCRKMEESVWPDPTVLRLLNEEFVIASLYVDDRTPLEESEKYTSTFSGKNIRWVGQKWSDFQAERFGTNAQPYYVIVDHNGNQLVPAEAYNEDIQNYINFLETGLKVFQEGK